MTVERAVIQVLTECKVPPHFRGFRYLHTAIVMCYEDVSLLDMRTKKLYPDIAKRYKTTWTAVERAMRTAREASLSKHQTTAEFIGAAVWFLRTLPDIDQTG